MSKALSGLPQVSHSLIQQFPGLDVLWSGWGWGRRRLALDLVPGLQKRQYEEGRRWRGAGVREGFPGAVSPRQGDSVSSGHGALVQL